MPEPKLQHQSPVAPDDRRVAAPGEAERRAPRPPIEDPLEELARILGEGAYPARPEPAAEPGRRANASARPMPQQLSALEAELFDELRSSVTPEVQVRGNFEREVTPPIPQRPVDDRDIASLRISQQQPPPASEPEPPRSAEGEAAQWSDFYAYDDGVAAGSYDPAFAQQDPRYAAYEAAPPVAAQRRPQQNYPQATFDEFGREEIAAAAREAAPYLADEPRIMPHSRAEQRAAAQMRQDRRGGALTWVIAAIVLVAAGGGGWAAWKYTGLVGSGEPKLIHADGKPLKTIPEPSKTTTGDAAPTLTPDNPKEASKIVSLQEDPVDQVSGRTAEGKEVRLINPGAPRPSTDVPHTVKTVVVRPDGSIVSDGAAAARSPRAAAPAAPADGGTDAGAAPDASTAAAPGPTAPQIKTVTTTPTSAATPAPKVAAPVAAPTPPAPAAAAPATPAPAPKAAAPTPTPVPAAPAAKPTAATPQTPPQVKTVAVTPITVNRQPAGQPSPAPGGGGAPMALGPVAPKLASTPPSPPPAAPVAAKPAPSAPVAITPPAASAGGGGGDFMVQISASGSEAAARSSFAAAQRKYSALAGRSVDVQRADLGSKGVFYRARVPAGSREQAAALCGQITAQGGQCMVVKR